MLVTLKKSSRSNELVADKYDVTLLYSKLNREFHFTRTIDETKNLPFSLPVDEQIRGQNTFCIPTTLNIEKWVEHAATECRHRDTIIVLLIPSMTSYDWFHRYICEKPGIVVRFIERSTFASSLEGTIQNWMLVIFTNKRRKFRVESWKI